MHHPTDVATRWQEAWNAGDADGIAALFAEDAEFVNVVGLWWHDHEDIRDAHAFGFRAIFPGSRITMGTPRLRRLGAATPTGGSDAALVQCRWRITGQRSPDGAPAGEREGIFTFVLERRSGGWIAVAAQNTDVVPGRQTHINRAGEHSPIHYRERLPTRPSGEASGA